MNQFSQLASMTEVGKTILFNFSHYHMFTNISTNTSYLSMNSKELSQPKNLTDHIFLLIYSTIFVIGLVGNCLVIYFVLFYKRMQTMTNKLITNLSIADLLVICFCVPVTASQHVSRNWVFGEVVCRASGFVQGNLTL